MHDRKELLRGGAAKGHPRGGRVAFALAVVLAAVACEGENIFDGGGNGLGKPEIVELIAPDTAEAGRFVDLEVHAKAGGQIAEFTLQLRGAVESDSTVVVASPLSEIEQPISFIVEPPVRDTLLEVTVRAVDAAGSKSDPVSDTIWIRDTTAPSFDGVAIEPDTAGIGETIAISVEALDNIRLAETGYAVVDADGDTLTLELAPVAGSKADSTLFQYEVPITAAPGAYEVVGLATDLEGLRGASAPVKLTIEDRSEPAVDILKPGGNATFPLGDSILVEFRVVDNGGVASARLEGVAVRGDPDLGTQVEIQRFTPKSISLPDVPRDTTLKRYLIATADRTSETVYLIVSATDDGGEVGVDTVAVSIGGPRVEIRSPEDGDSVQSGVSVTIAASDPAKIERLELIATGVVEDTFTYVYSTPLDSVMEQPTIALPSGATGTLELQATALSTLSVPGRSTPVVLTVVSNAGGPTGDEIAPSLSLEVLPCDRVNCERFELTDSLRVRVHARDNSVITRLGVTAIGVNATTGDTLTQQRTAVFSPALSGLIQRDFAFAPFNIDPLSLPDTVSFEFYAFAVDAAGNCAAAVIETEQQLTCATFRGDTVAGGGVSGLPAEMIAVSGHTVMLPGGGHIADAVVEMDTTNSQYRLYLSNFSGNSVEVLSLADTTFGAPVRVGAQPWGLFIDRSGDTLFVANSGGANISSVLLDAAPTEIVPRRLLTPNAVLYQLRFTTDNIGRIKYTVEFHDFSDRPQFVAVDSMGRLLYSTVPTGAAPDGTVRVVDRNPVTDPLVTNDLPEIQILFDEAEAIDPADGAIAIANVDSLIVRPDPEGNDILVFYDHKPGFPDQTVSVRTDEQVPSMSFSVALDSLIARSGDSTIVRKPGVWVVANVGMSDTTFLAPSGDRGRVGFGEGATAPTGRVMVWDAATAGITDDVPVADLVNNASDRVLGLGLNVDGSMGVFRGVEAAYFFNRDLRQLGLYEADFGAQGAGAALHWAHEDPLVEDESAVAFVATSAQTIKVINTLHFYEVNELHIRDNVAGPMRVTSPLPTDNGGQGAACVGPDCVVAKLYGVTSAGGVVVLDILRRDITSP